MTQKIFGSGEKEGGKKDGAAADVSLKKG